ncbi:hypothetical protein [Streptomyces sp. NPDC048111]|uniref:hypothetical protein n=1 Tax=Streptomyces sp. NPDC048111 TaxID=3365500 RepID=UPI003723E907
MSFVELDDNDSGALIMVLASWDRDFKIWAYSFSYWQLLLRSAPKSPQDLRIDVLFSNVGRVNISAQISGLSIEVADFESERNRLGIGEVPDGQFKLLLLNCGPSYVLATQCQWHEDREWLDAPPRFGPLRGVS